MEDDTLAIIGDREITREMLEEELEMIPPYQRENFTSLEGRRALLEHMIERELLLMAAIDAGLDSDTTVLTRVETATQQLKDVRKRSLIQSYYQRFVVETVTVPEEDILAYYEEHSGDMFFQDAQVRASHLLVSSDGDAEEIGSLIDQGVPFDSLVRTRSEHLATVSSGGDIGWVTRGMAMPYLGDQPEISEALFLLEPGEVAGPFRTDLGYHWFEVTEVRDEGQKPLEEVRASIENMLLPALVNSYFKDELIPALHTEYDVTVIGEDGSGILATVGDLDITTDMLELEIQMIPPYQRPNFETPEGRQLLLGHIIERELLFQAALDAGLEEDSFVVAQMELAQEEIDLTRDMTMIQVYYDTRVVQAVTVPEEDIQAYYQEHMDDIYHQEPQIRVSHILSDSEASIIAARDRLDAGDSFEAVAADLSNHAPTAAIGGDLGWVTLNSPLPYIEDSGELTNELYRAGEGAVLGPYSTELGYHLFTVTDFVEEGPKPLEDVRGSILDALRPGLVNSYLRETVFPALYEEYGVRVNEEAFLPGRDVPADSLMQMAQELMGTDPAAAIQYFELFLERFPDHPKADQAQFLIGFTYSEQLGDYESAREAFALVVSEYPGSELADDAGWMIENMDRPIEEFLPQEDLQEEAVPQ